MRSAPGPSFSIPPDVAQVFERFVAAEYAYFTPKGEPLCWPVTPYWYPERGVLAVATGLAYPNKAAHAKRNPKVSLLFSDPTSSGLDDPPEILVQGDATVLDEDLQENTDRYVRELRAKFPVARLGVNPMTVRFLDFYLPRLWVEITPARIVTCARDKQTILGRPIESLEGVSGSRAPAGEGVSGSRASYGVLKKFDSAVLTARGADGYPIPKRIRPQALANGMFQLEEEVDPGPACLTFHRHVLGGTRFEAYMVRGTVTKSGEETKFIPKKLVGFFGNGLVFPLSVISKVAHLRSRLRRELINRNQEMPKLRIP